MDMNNDLKLIFYNNGRDPGYEIKKPYFNDAEETFRIYCSNVGEEFSSLYRFHSGSEILTFPQPKFMILLRREYKTCYMLHVLIIKII